MMRRYSIYVTETNFSSTNDKENYDKSNSHTRIIDMFDDKHEAEIEVDAASEPEPQRIINLSDDDKDEPVMLGYERQRKEQC